MKAVIACTLAAAALSTLVAAEQPCCQEKCSKAGEQKYWSIAKSLFDKPHCGECCMNPSEYSLYHFFEKNLTKSMEDNPCEVRGYPKYDSTVTHGFGPVSITLDLYNLPDEPVKVEEEVVKVAEPCCQGKCEVGEQKYWSIAKSLFDRPHCGECCMNPSTYSVYHFFEKNLTKSMEDNPCEVRGYPKYDSTVTHGFGPVSITLDLYNLPVEPVKVEEEVLKIAEPCCQGKCQKLGEQKYWSIAKSLVDKPHCGECCMNPSEYSLYHFFEKNLTKSMEDNPCEVLGYPKYDSTVTHGFGLVSMTLDLYNLPDEVAILV